MCSLPRLQSEAEPKQGTEVHVVHIGNTAFPRLPRKRETACPVQARSLHRRSGRGEAWVGRLDRTGQGKVRSRRGSQARRCGKVRRLPPSLAIVHTHPCVLPRRGGRRRKALAGTLLCAEARRHAPAPRTDREITGGTTNARQIDMRQASGVRAVGQGQIILLSLSTLCIMHTWAWIYPDVCRVRPSEWSRVESSRVGASLIKSRPRSVFGRK